MLRAGQRRENLAGSAEQMFEEDFVGRCLPFDETAASEYALLVATRTRNGRPISTEDGQITATALNHGLPLATRNPDFDTFEAHFSLTPSNSAGFRAWNRKTPRYMDC